MTQTHRLAAVVTVLMAAMVPATAAGAPAGVEKLESNVRVSGFLAEIDVAPPDVVFDSVDGEYLTVWRDERGGSEGAIVGQRLSVGGERIGSDFAVSAPIAEGTRNVAVAHNAVDNECLVVWRDDRAWETRRGDIFGQRLLADGSRAGKSFRISGAFALGRDDNPAVAHNVVDNEYLVV